MSGTGERPTVAAVIPARLHSRRFPRKVLARETGKYLIEHVYESVVGAPAVDRVVIATDDEEVAAAARSFGAPVQMTRDDHVSGTDRVAEVAERLDHDIIVNVQGDEPFVEHDDLATLVELFADPQTVMTTLVVERSDAEGLADPNTVKAVVGLGAEALYFSRAPIPHADGAPDAAWLQHVGMYAYRREFLTRLTALAPSPLERRERLEQLRVLENGFRIRVGVSPHAHLGVDTEADYRQFVDEYRRRGGQ